jgi:hypothetical protein
LPITLRTGPGTEYELGTQQILANESVRVTGDARDPDTQQAWWRVEDATHSGWVPFNEVTTTGNCALIPAIVFALPTETDTAIPPTATVDLNALATLTLEVTSQSGVSFATNALPYNQTAPPPTVEPSTSPRLAPTTEPTIEPTLADTASSGVSFATNALPYPTPGN